MKALKIMVVDDSIITVEKISAMLENMGHTVVSTAKTGSEALTKYPEVKPDLMTMDITMPELDGIETTKQIISIDPSALIVMVTSQGQERMVMDSLDAGAKGYVLKPIKPDKLQLILEQIVDKYT